MRKATPRPSATHYRTLFSLYGIDDAYLQTRAQRRATGFFLDHLEQGGFNSDSPIPKSQQKRLKRAFNNTPFLNIASGLFTVGALLLMFQTSPIAEASANTATGERNSYSQHLSESEYVEIVTDDDGIHESENTHNPGDVSNLSIHLQARNTPADLAISEPKPEFEVVVDDDSDLPGASHELRALTVIDTSIQNWQSLRDAVASGDVLLLEGDNAPLDTILEKLSSMERVDALNIISHGDSGRLQIKNHMISSDSLRLDRDRWQKIGSRISEDGDILLFGCNVAKGEKGRAFIEELARATGADVAASVDVTGHTSLQGDWDLEATTGAVVHNSVLSNPTQWQGSLATYKFSTVSTILSTGVYSLTGTLFNGTNAFKIKPTYRLKTSSSGFIYFNKDTQNAYTFYLKPNGSTLGSFDISDMLMSNGCNSLGNGSFTTFNITGYLKSGGPVTTSASGTMNTGQSKSLVTDLGADFTGFNDVVKLKVTEAFSGGQICAYFQNMTLSDLQEPPPNDDGTVTAAGGVSEPVDLLTTASSGSPLNVFDFAINDGGGDATTVDVSQIVVNLGGTSSANFSKMRFNLTGCATKTAVAPSGSSVTFTSTGIVVSNGSSVTCTVQAYWNDNTGITDNQTLTLSVDGDADLTVDGAKTTMSASNTPVTTGNMSTEVVATKLSISTQPAGSVSHTPLTTQPVLRALDAVNNLDLDYSTSVVASEDDVGSLVGTKTITPVAGVATFTDLQFNALADQSNFQIDFASSGLTGVTSNTITSDVVATQLIFTTEPAPTTLKNGETTAFTTVPVVKAINAGFVIDQGYGTDITIEEVLGAGSATMTGTGDTDLSAASVTVTPSSGTATFTGLSVTYTNNDFAQNETFKLRASSGALTTADSTTLTSLGRAIAFSQPTPYSANEDAGTANVVTLTRTGDTSGTASVQVSVTGGTATGGGTDYVSTGFPLTVNFADAETSKTVPVAIVDDNLFETFTPETITFSLGSPVDTGIGAQTTATLEIVDNEAPPTVSLGITGSPVTENAGVATVTATLDHPSVENVTVTLAFSGTATGGGTDYTASAPTIPITAGNTANSITLTAFNDTLDEDDETIIVDIGSVTNGTENGTQQVTATITDDDPTPTLSIDDVSANEGDSGTTTFDFTVSLSAASGRTVSVDYATDIDTATVADNDFSAAGPTTLTFNPGETTKTVSVTVNGDSLHENDETFFVDLTNPSNATLADDQGLGTIQNDDAQPTVNFTVASQTVSESTPSATITAELSSVSGLEVTLPFSVNGSSSATAVDDYTLSPSPLTIAAGDTSADITVTLVDNAVDGPDKTVVVDLGTPTNAGAGIMTSHTLTLEDDEVSLVINEVDYAQDAADSAEFIEIKNISAAPINLDAYTLELVDDNGGSPSAYQVIDLPDVDLPADGYYVICDTAADVPNCNLETGLGDDFIQDGDPDAVSLMLGSFQVDVVSYGGDASGYTETAGTVADDGSQAFVGLSRFPDGADSDDNSTDLSLRCITPGGPNALEDAVGCFELSIDDVSGLENSGSLQFTVNLSHPATGSVSVSYATADDSATAGSDYTGVGSTTLTFSAGETSRTVDVTLLDDSTDEPDETFTVDLSNPVNGQISDASGQGTIQDDDAASSLTVSNTTVTEGDGGTATATFTVSLTPASGKTVTVDYTTAAGTATAGTDFTAIGTTTLAFDPGQTSKTVNVTVNGDLTDEDDETFNLNLSNPVNATIGTASGTGTITDDDTATLSIDDVVVTEGGGSADFTVSLSTASSRTVTVNYASADGTAAAGSDYTPVSGTLTFSPGQISRTASVTVLDDFNDEDDESFQVNLSGANNAAINDAQGIGTITDNDLPPTLSINDLNMIAEGDIAQFSVTLSAASAKTVTVEASTLNGSALAGQDFDAFAGSLVTFSPGDTSKLVSVQTTDDSLEEGAEGFSVQLSNPFNASIADNTGSGSILANDDDGTPAASEEQVPSLDGIGTGDGDGSGIADSVEGHVSSIQTFDNNDWATLRDNNGHIVTNVQSLAVPDGHPVNITFPYGAFEFLVTGLTAGETVQMSIFIPFNPAINGYWKPDINGDWRNIATNVVHEGVKTRVDIEMVEGGEFDEETFAGGMNNPTTLTDQGGPGILPMQTTGVPTISDWSRWLLSVLLGGMAWMQLRRRQKAD